MEYNSYISNVNSSWRYIDGDGTFEWKNPHSINQLYFPLCNEAGMMSAVTPNLNGTATTGQNSFLMRPVTLEDLHNNLSARNFWIYNEELGAYSLTGNSAAQKSKLFTDENTVDTTIRGTFLAHTLVRVDPKAGIKSEITGFCPVTGDKVEIMWVKVTNVSDKAISFTPTTAIPIYARSAENLRDHNHWTSLAHRMQLYDWGLSIKPEILHDERGHKPNHSIYYTMAFRENGELPVGQFPTVAEFIGEGGGFDWPVAVVQNIPPYKKPICRRDGMEAIGAIRFGEVTLEPRKTAGFIVIMGVTEDKDTITQCIKKYGDGEKAGKALSDNLSYWKERVERITFNTGSKGFDTWMHWVSLQPILRKIYGNSFLPHFDYGKGGRGWRDLWQDCLALILQNPGDMRDELVANYAGVRLDGSNATIIKKGLGEFAADRNRVSRVWMDHGLWPFYTLKLYIDQTGDVDILFSESMYWHDHQIRRAKGVEHDWKASDGNRQKTLSGEIYRGSVVEHILVQHLTCFHNVGDHNNIKLEDGDWNDLLDMASEKGETVPFTAFYGSNLISISKTLLHYKELKKIDKIELFTELLLLTGLKRKTDYVSPDAKRKRLYEYFESIEKGFSGEKVEVSIDALANDLEEKGNWILEHVRKAEWIKSNTGYGFFNGYYNNDGQRVDGDHKDCTRMNLTAQTFAIMSGAATDVQVLKSYEAAKAILKDPNTGGYRLTTPLGPNTWNFGRGFAVVYGEKETGGTFNHMVVMFINALYGRGFVREGYEVFQTLYELCNDIEKSKIYPGLPEYISYEGRGMYPYLSGSASWLLMTVLTEMFGIKGYYGDLILDPKLVKKQFDIDGYAKAHTLFCGSKIEVLYSNTMDLDYNEYRINRIRINGNDIDFLIVDEKKAKIKKADLEFFLKKDCDNRIDVFLDKT